MKHEDEDEDETESEGKTEEEIQTASSQCVQSRRSRVHPV